MELCVESKYILYLRFFKVATLCFDDSFAHSRHFYNVENSQNKEKPLNE